MFTRKAHIGLIVVFTLLISSASFFKVDGAIRLPESKLNQILKRADTNYASRQKRYTDFQEQASAVCTGLCMYMEEKSYIDCFDMCNY